MMIFKAVSPESKVFLTPEENRAYAEGLYYALQQVQIYAAEEFFKDTQDSEVVAGRLKMLAGDFMQKMITSTNGAQLIEKLGPAPKQVTEEHCDDCRIKQGPFIDKGDHHGGTKHVCQDRDACHRRSPG